MALNFLDEIDNHTNALAFSSPSGATKPSEYGQVVYKPDDLETIKTKISSEPMEIRNYNELQKEIARMFLNAIMFNRSDSTVSIFENLNL